MPDIFLDRPLAECPSGIPPYRTLSAPGTADTARSTGLNSHGHFKSKGNGGRHASSQCSVNSYGRKPGAAPNEWRVAS